MMILGESSSAVFQPAPGLDKWESWVRLMETGGRGHLSTGRLKRVGHLATSLVAAT
jgi:hypothetical protein